MPRGSGASKIGAEIPNYEVVDFSFEYLQSEQWTLHGDSNNLLSEDCYSQGRADGIESAQERTFYVGLRFEIR